MECGCILNSKSLLYMKSNFVELLKKLKQVCVVLFASHKPKAAFFKMFIMTRILERETCEGKKILSKNQKIYEPFIFINLNIKICFR